MLNEATQCFGNIRQATHLGEQLTPLCYLSLLVGLVSAQYLLRLQLDFFCSQLSTCIRFPAFSSSSRPLSLPRAAKNTPGPSPRPHPYDHWVWIVSHFLDICESPSSSSDQ